MIFGNSLSGASSATLVGGLHKVNLYYIESFRLPFHIAVKVKKNCLRNVMQTFPILFIIIIIIIIIIIRSFIFLQYKK